MLNIKEHEIDYNNLTRYFYMDIDRSELSDGTIIILAFIFVVLQILGGMFGFKWGFAGQDSKNAFKSIGNGRYTTYSELRDHYEQVGDVTQSKLENLQQRLPTRSSA